MNPDFRFDQKLKFLAILRIESVSKSKQDIAKTFKDFVEVITKISSNEFSRAFSTHDGQTLGVFYKSTHHPENVRRLIQVETSIAIDDSLFILEIGQHWTALGNSNAFRWLQHH